MDNSNNTQNIDISLIVPVYNGLNGIDNCIDSIFAQKNVSLEVIFIDDGSSDDSFNYIKSRLNNQKNDIQVQIITQKNSGVAYTRNRGIEIANGKYIMFADQDDKFLSDYCSVYYEAITQGDFDVVVGGYERVRTDGKVIKKVYLKDTEWSKFIVPAPWAHIYKKSFLLENNIRFLDSSIGEDIYFNFIAYSKTNKVKTIPNASYKWLFNPTSVSNSKQNIISEKVDPIFLMDNIYDGIEDIRFRDSILVEYYMARYVCWYMLFSSRGSRKKDIKTTYNKLHNWLETHYPNYKQNPYLGFKMPKGEILGTHIFVFVYYFLLRLRLLPGVLTWFGV